MDRQKLVESANMSCICRSILQEMTNIEEKEKEKGKERETRTQEVKPHNSQLLGQVPRTSPEEGEKTRETRSVLFTLFIFALLQTLISSVRRVQEKFRNNDDPKLADKFGSPKRRTLLGNPTPFLTAYLAQLNDKNYCLDFKWRNNENAGTFILQKIAESDRRRFYTPVSNTTKSDEVLQQAKKWIEMCRSKGESGHLECPGENGERSFYPTRLIDLGTNNPDTGQWPEQVRLIETAEFSLKDHYVTLSHCWGTAEIKRLSPENKNELLRDGIAVKELPKTFRHAIKFARRLGSVRTFEPRPDLTIPFQTVRYIWIDSLCIMEGDRVGEQNMPVQPKPNANCSELSETVEAKNDWLRESAKMYEIYNKAYCNLSATASSSSDGGLFRKRNPQTLWEDEINLNVEGIPVDPRLGNQASIQRCVINDLSFWARTVDDAPVNKRGWVLQERMMAGRVIHFCENQIAWECNHLEAAESARDGLPNLHIQHGIKPATGSASPGCRDMPSKQRRGSYPAYSLTADNESVEQTYSESVEHWQTVVERYSKTKLTNAGDKVIALSGYARMKSEEFPGNCEYRAGMWTHHLESQLLWHVHPVFTNGEFEYPSNRPDKYRAPTWSWASVDAPQGITCSEISNKRLHIKVENISDNSSENPTIILGIPSNKFGLVVGGQLVLLGVLKNIVMNKWETNGAIRYGWNLRSTDGQGSSNMHSIVFLDSPDSDTDIFGSHGRMYLLPARGESDGYLICLLLQLEHDKIGNETGMFRRVGLTKVSPYEGDNAIKVVCEPTGDEASIPHSHWNASLQKHRIIIV